MDFIIADPEGQMQHANMCDVCGVKIMAHPSRHFHIRYEYEGEKHPIATRVACVCAEHASEDKREALKRRVQATYRSNSP